MNRKRTKLLIFGVSIAIVLVSIQLGASVSIDYSASPDKTVLDTEELKEKALSKGILPIFSLF